MLSTLTRTKLLAAVMAIFVVAAACGGGTSAPTAATGASASAAQGELPKPELTKVRIGISAPTEPVQFAAKLADQMGFYQKLGMTAEITGFEGDGKALQALVAGQLDFFVGGASVSITSVTTDTPVKVVSMNSVINTDGLYCQKDIKTPSDVKGKSVAISTFGGTSHGSAILTLQGIGLTPKDATITQVGNEGSRIAALKGGSAACAVIGIQQDAQMKSFGLNLLIDLTKAKPQQQWGRSGLLARTDFIAKNPNTVLNVVAAGLLAQNLFWTDQATVTAKFAEWTQLKLDDAKVLVSAFPDYGDRGMMFDEQAFKAPKEVLASVNPALAGVDVTKAYDLSFLNKLKAIGFYTKNNIPLQ